ncbi:MAG TPA: DUF2059 domain-containing protein [Verrucomicrobiae bacterium]|nr:DUF2059 domain-containing protein [Verrucomicrobiae bacterium]
MRFHVAVLSALAIASPSLARAQANAAPAAQPKPAQHQPGTMAPQAPAHTPGETAKKPADAGDSVDPAKEVAIRHLMDITQTTKLGENMGTYLTSQLHDVMSRAMTPEKLSSFMDAFSQKFAATSPGTSVTDAMVPIYSKAFSMEDIQGLIAFYESPLGQRVVKTLPEVVQQSQEAGMEIEQVSAMKILRSMTDQYPELKQVLPPDGGNGNSEAAPSPAPTAK